MREDTPNNPSTRHTRLETNNSNLHPTPLTLDSLVRRTTRLDHLSHPDLRSITVIQGTAIHGVVVPSDRQYLKILGGHKDRDDNKDKGLAPLVRPHTLVQRRLPLLYRKPRLRLPQLRDRDRISQESRLSRI